jgi:hypothetical protein
MRTVRLANSSPAFGDPVSQGRLSTLKGRVAGPRIPERQDVWAYDPRQGVSWAFSHPHVSIQRLLGWPADSPGRLLAVGTRKMGRGCSPAGRLFWIDRLNGGIVREEAIEPTAFGISLDPSDELHYAKWSEIRLDRTGTRLSRLVFANRYPGSTLATIDAWITDTSGTPIAEHHYDKYVGYGELSGFVNGLVPARLDPAANKLWIGFDPLWTEEAGDSFFTYHALGWYEFNLGDAADAFYAPNDLVWREYPGSSYRWDPAWATVQPLSGVGWTGLQRHRYLDDDGDHIGSVWYWCTPGFRREYATFHIDPMGLYADPAAGRAAIWDPAAATLEVGDWTSEPLAGYPRPVTWPEDGPCDLGTLASDYLYLPTIGEDGQEGIGCWKVGEDRPAWLDPLAAVRDDEGYPLIGQMVGDADGRGYVLGSRSHLRSGNRVEVVE